MWGGHLYVLRPLRMDQAEARGAVGEAAEPKCAHVVQPPVGRYAPCTTMEQTQILGFFAFTSSPHKPYRPLAAPMPSAQPCNQTQSWLLCLTLSSHNGGRGMDAIHLIRHWVVYCNDWETKVL